MKIKILFTDFWKDFNVENNFFTNILKKKYDLEINEKPDLLIYSNYGRNYLKYNCFKVFYSSENARPNYNLCDFSFSFDYSNNPKNYRLPLFALYDDVNKLVVKKNLEDTVKTKRKFCNFIYSNPNAKERIDFYNLLSKYKSVDSAGRLFNNGFSIGKMPNDKLNFISEYKFTIAFENSSYPGYTTEKIFQPMQVGSIPIYWGNPLIEKDFNPRSFINVMSFPSYKDVVDWIVKVDTNDDLYNQYRKEPYFIDNKVPFHLTEDSIGQQFDYIISGLSERPVAKTVKGMLRSNFEFIQPLLLNKYRKFLQRLN